MDGSGVEAVGAVNAEHGEPWRTFLSARDVAGLVPGMRVRHVTQHDLLSGRKDALRPSNVSVISRVRR